MLSNLTGYLGVLVCRGGSCQRYLMCLDGSAIELHGRYDPAPPYAAPTTARTVADSGQCMGTGNPSLSAISPSRYASGWGNRVTVPLSHGLLTVL